MTYSNKSELIKILEKNGLYTQKKLGQNFLTDMGALKRIVDTANLTSEDFVIEVGPGLGVLTQELVKHSGNVLAIEIDPKIVPILKARLHAENLKILLADALQMPLPDMPYKLVANIPYYITSPLINHFLQPRSEFEQRPVLIVLLVQKEVAEKICTAPGDHSVLSLQVQIFGHPEIVGKVPASSFFPAPEVDSSILRITPHPEPLIKDPALFFRIIHATFAQRRKTLSNSLRNGLGFSKEQIAAALDKTQLGHNARPQELTIQDWQKLLDALTP